MILEHILTTMWRIRSIRIWCTLIILVTSFSACAGNPTQTTATLSSTADPTSTFTPRPSVRDTPTTSPTPYRTPTPDPVTTHSSPTDTPTTTPDITLTPTQTVLGANGTTYSSNLLYMSDHQLMRWDHVTNFVILISDHVYEYSVNPEGKLVALMRSQNVVANGVEMFELGLLDFDSKQITPIIEGSPLLHSISISPDGEWIAYFPNENGGRLSAIRTDGSGESIELGFCHQTLNTPCAPVSWSPDSRDLLWSDQRGVWHTRLDWENPQLITNNSIEVTDPEGEISQITVSFGSLTWSPTGRYALSVVTPTTSSTQWNVILDTRRMRFIDVPESFQSGTSMKNIIWLNDGTLMASNGLGNAEVILTLWEVVPTQNDLLRFNNNYTIDSDDLPTPIDNSITEWSYIVDWLYQFDERLLGFGVRVLEDNVSPILLNLELQDNYTESINHVPSYTENVLWSPDGQGALIIGTGQELFFSPSNGGMLIDLIPVLGEEAREFYWLPPTRRS